MSKKKRIIKSRGVRILLRLLAVMLVVFAALVLFIQSRWGQQIIVSKAVAYLEDKIGTEVSIDKLYLSFSGDVTLDGFYMEDQKGDSLVYSKNLQVSLSLMPLIRGTKIHIKHIDWQGLQANIDRDVSGRFNFDYITEAFASEDTTAVDTTSNMEFVLDDLKFKNFKLKYDNRQQGMLANLELGHLGLRMDVFDLENMEFAVDALEFTDSKIAYTQTKALTETETDTTDSSTTPILSIKDLQLNNLEIDYRVPPDKLDLSIDLGNSALSNAEIDLSQSKIGVDRFLLENSQMTYKDDSVVRDSIPDPKEDTTAAFMWPEYRIAIQEIALLNNDLSYQHGEVALHRELNPSDLQLIALTLKAQDIYYKPGELRLHLKDFRFREADRFALKQLAFELDINHQSTSVKGLTFATQHSSLRGALNMSYPTLDAFMEHPETADFSIKLPFQLDFRDLGYLQPELLKNTYLDSLSSSKLSGEFISNGNLDSLTVESFKAQWRQTQIHMNGVLRSVLNTDSLKVAIANLDIQSHKKDIHSFVSAEELGVMLPDSLHLFGSLSGSLSGGIADLELQSSQGNIEFSGNYLNANAIKYAVDLRTEHLNIGNMIGDDKLAPISISLKSMGVGTSLNTLTASLTSGFDSLNYAGYDLTPLKLNGQITGGVGDVQLEFKDENLDLNTLIHMELDTVHSVVGLVMDLKGADLYQLGLTTKDIRTALKLNANFKGNLENFELNSSLNDGVIVVQNNSYDIGTLHLQAKISEQATQLEIDHQNLQGQLDSNVNPQQLSTALANYFKNHWSDSLVVDTLKIDTMAVVNLNLHLKNGPLLNRALFPGLQTMDSIGLTVNFDQQKQQLEAHLEVPHLNYEEKQVDSLRFDLKGSDTVMDFELGWRQLTAAPLSMGRTSLKGGYDHKNLKLQFVSKDSLVDVVNLSSEISFKNDSIRLKMLTDPLILNRENWQIGVDNEITYTTNYIGVRDFQLKNGSQSIGLERIDNSTDEVSLKLLFENFKFATLVSLLNPGEPLVKGNLNGELEVDNIFSQTGIQADLTIADFEALEVPLGVLKMKAIADQQHRYQLDLSLKEGYVDLDIGGNYLAMENDGTLDFTLDIHQIELKALEKLAGESISNTSGYISGNASISGRVSDPIYKGSFNFHQASFTANVLNTRFGLEDESLDFNNDGFQLNAVEITDADGNTFTLDGTIGTEQLSKPSFDLVMKASQFKVLNSTKEDNELFYGNVSLDTDISIKGDAEIPMVRGSIKINEGSRFTVVVPESELDINEREGVVVFVNKTNTNDILTKNQLESKGVRVMENFDLDVALNVDRNSTFTVVMDSRTGDNLEVTGRGEFNFSMEPNGRTNLSGQYEVEAGHYAASLYNIVRRRFDIAQGSKITWNGDPLEAQLDIQAIYNVETSASPLMATQTAGVSEDVMRSYRQELPFMVYLNIDGELLSPELSFQLDMPESYQAVLGGNVYGYVQQLNNQEEELNKQVFSLLVLNRFFPSSGSDGSVGGPASIARDNVNDVLSDQLNAFSDKLMGNTGVELDFGLDSYTDYQSSSPKERTELDINASKSLFDDRLIIQVGSEVDIQGKNNTEDRNTPVIGNVALEYLITRDGRYRLRGYRKNQFESVVDGELIVTGISLIFSKEFNKFKELWEKQVQQALEKEEKVKENNSELEKLNRKKPEN